MWPIIAIVFAVGVLVILTLILLVKGDENLDKMVEKALEKGEDTQLPEAEFAKAQVFSKKNDSYYSMGKLPQLIERYFITFLTEAGRKLELRVSKDWFNLLEEGQEGTLVTVSGRFLDFGEGREYFEGDEEIEEIVN